MRKAAKHPKAIFDKILEEFIETAKNKSIMVAMKTNLKGVKRGIAKAQAKFGGDVTQISDVVRATVVVTGDVKDLYDAVAMFKELPALRSSLVNISNYDDRFAKPLHGGYRDINVLLRVVHRLNLRLLRILSILNWNVGFPRST